MIWCDRIAILWAGIVFAVLWWATNDDTLGLVRDLMQPAGLRAFATLILPVWLGLRLLHFAFRVRLLNRVSRRP